MRTFSEADYDKLCKACDLILNASNSPVRIANTTLNVIREHPIFLQNYSPVFLEKNYWFSYVLFMRFLNHLTIGGLKFFHAIYQNFLLRDRLSNPKKKYKNIFLTHLLNESFIGNLNDFYFFELPMKLDKPKSKSLLVYINFTNKSAKSLQKKINNKSKNALVLPRYISLHKELMIRFRLLKDALSILFTPTKSNFEKKVKYLAAVEALSSASHSNLRIAMQMAEITQMVKPSNLFTTYEGHPWERLTYYYSRKRQQRLKCYAYQHALLFKKQHAAKRKLPINYEPNIILCSGEQGKSEFEEIQFLPKKKIILFGSTRTLKSDRSQLEVKLEIKPTFLFLPEGDLIECLPFISFALELSKMYPDCNFILRLHPITKMGEVLKFYPALKSCSKNLKISSQTFEEDLANASFAIYRGSTTIVKAIEVGLVPLYLKKEDEISIDPLHGASQYKYNLENPEDLNFILNISHSELRDNQNKLKKHVSTFFSELNYENVLSIVEDKVNKK